MSQYHSHRQTENSSARHFLLAKLKAALSLHVGAYKAALSRQRRGLTGQLRKKESQFSVTLPSSSGIPVSRIEFFYLSPLSLKYSFML